MLPDAVVFRQKQIAKAQSAIERISKALDALQTATLGIPSDDFIWAGDLKEIANGLNRISMTAADLADMADPARTGKA